MLHTCTERAFFIYSKKTNAAHFGGALVSRSSEVAFYTCLKPLSSWFMHNITIWPLPLRRNPQSVCWGVGGVLYLDNLVIYVVLLYFSPLVFKKQDNLFYFISFAPIALTSILAQPLLDAPLVYLFLFTTFQRS